MKKPKETKAVSFKEKVKAFLERHPFLVAVIVIIALSACSHFGEKIGRSLYNSGAHWIPAMGQYGWIPLVIGALYVIAGYILSKTGWGKRHSKVSEIVAWVVLVLIFALVFVTGIVEGAEFVLNSPTPSF